jgi:hypothetical protein
MSFLDLNLKGTPPAPVKEEEPVVYYRMGSGNDDTVTLSIKHQEVTFNQAGLKEFINRINAFVVTENETN